MFDKASLKLGLDKAVLQSMGSNKDTQNAVSVCGRRDAGIGLFYTALELSSIFISSTPSANDAPGKR